MAFRIDSDYMTGKKNRPPHLIPVPHDIWLVVGGVGPLGGCNFSNQLATQREDIHVSTSQLKRNNTPAISNP